MAWRDLTRTERNTQYRCHLFLALVRDDTGEELGSIMQFYEDCPCYALLVDRRLGPYETLEEAKAAVENPSQARPMALFVPPKTGEH